MNRWIVWMGIAAALAAFHATGPAAKEPASADGLVRVASRALDEVRMRPDANLGAYRAVTIDATPVAFAKDWRKSVNDTRGVGQWVRTEDESRIAADFSAALRESLASAFVARGYQVVPAAGPGVLRFAASASDVWVNAPDLLEPGVVAHFAGQQAGEATLRLEVRDGATGAVLAQVASRETASTVLPVERATSVSNLFYFSAMFRRFADASTRELRAQAPAP